MEDSRIEELIAEIRQAEDATVAQSRICGPPHLLLLMANRAGFLRIARACLEAILKPSREGTTQSLPVDLDGLEQSSADKRVHALVALQRMDNWPKSKEKPGRNPLSNQKGDRVALFGCAIVTIIFGTLFATGLKVWFEIIMGATR
jgi:hypothetical protein